MDIEENGSITVICGASCKGLEFDAVFLPSLETYSPDPSKQTEFKMNMYVRISRARSYLFLSYTRGNGKDPEILSLFPSKLVQRCEDVSHQKIKIPRQSSQIQAKNGNDTVRINGFILVPYKKAILVSGNTYSIKDDLKRMGGRWFNPEKSWMFPGSRKNEIINFLKEV